MKVRAYFIITILSFLLIGSSFSILTYAQDFTAEPTIGRDPQVTSSPGNPPSPTLGSDKPVEELSPGVSPTLDPTNPPPSTRERILYLNSTKSSTADTYYEKTGITLPPQTVKLSVDALVYYAGVRGLEASLFCAAASCPGGKVNGQKYEPVIIFNQNTVDFRTKTVQIAIPGQGTYGIRIYGYDGTEADIDNVKLMVQGAAGPQTIDYMASSNGSFDEVLNPIPSLLRNQPNGWGAGTGNWGYDLAGVNTNYQGKTVLSFNSSSRIKRDFNGGPLWSRYEQSIQGGGTYTLEVTAWAAIIKDRGISVALACGMDQGCPGGKAVNEVYEPQLRLSQGTTFATTNTTITVPDNGTYFLRIFVNDGSEAMFDSVILKNAEGETVNANPSFDQITETQYRPNEPTIWTAGPSNVGYYFGKSANDISTTYCPLHSIGDANCDDLIDEKDYAIWKDEYVGDVNGLRADFNRDNKVNGVDFEIWRVHRFDIGISGNGTGTGTQSKPPMSESNITI